MGRLKKVPDRIYDFIDYDDWVEKSGGRRCYKAFCKTCGADRGYKRPNKFDSRCRACANVENRKKITKQHYKEHSSRMKNIEPWNKGLSKNDHSGLAAISRYMSEREVTLDTKKKISCTQRNIHVNDFTEFSTSETDKERAKFKGYRLNIRCLQRSKYTCDISNRKGGKLVAHHLNSWDSFPEERFSEDNLVCISEELHKEFHSIYGYGNNTKDQYNEFKVRKRKEYGFLG